MSEMSYFEKIKGEKFSSGLPRPKLLDALIGGCGGLILLGVLCFLHDELKLVPIFIVPFGASAVLVFAAPAAPFSQPRNVILGHFIAGLTGVVVFTICSSGGWWALAIANGVAIFLMIQLKAVHPPAGATSLLPVAAGITDFGWLLRPVLMGTIIIVLIGVLYNNLFKNRRYPMFWI